MYLLIWKWWCSSEPSWFAKALDIQTPKLRFSITGPEKHTIQTPNHLRRYLPGCLRSLEKRGQQLLISRTQKPAPIQTQLLPHFETRKRAQIQTHQSEHRRSFPARYLHLYTARFQEAYPRFPLPNPAVAGLEALWLATPPPGVPPPPPPHAFPSLQQYAQHPAPPPLPASTPPPRTPPPDPPRPTFAFPTPPPLRSSSLGFAPSFSPPPTPSDPPPLRQPPPHLFLGLCRHA